VKNNRKLIYSLVTICICVAVIVVVNYKKTIDVMNNNVGTKIILIDPGHGGIDGGAISKSGIVEKNINLSIALKLRDILRCKGYKVLMTRQEDVGLYSDKGRVRDKKIEDLSNRCKMKIESNCNMFISIHQNKFEQSKYYGAQVWYSYYEKSKILAHIIQKNLKKDLDNNNNRVEKSANNSIKVLRCHDTMPSVLVECGFLSNPIEAQKLTTDEYQNKIAESIANSVDEYYNKSDENGF